LLVEDNVAAFIDTLSGVEHIGRGARSWLGVPIAIGGEVFGVIAVQSYTTPRLYSEHHRDLLTAVAGQTAIALENTRLLEQTQTRAEELAVLNELGQALTARLTVQEVLDEAYRQAARLVDTTNFYVAIYNPEREEFHFALMITESEIDSQIGTLPVSQGLTGYMIRNRTSLLLSDNVRERQEALGIPHVGEEAESWLGVPLVVGDRVLGTLAVSSFTTPRLYDEHDRDLLMAIASPTAIAIENALLLEEAQARAERERLVRVITHRVRQGADRDIIMRTTLRELGEMLGASRSVIRLGTQEQLLSPHDGGSRPKEED
jgi:GAF domain-containing protein